MDLPYRLSKRRFQVSGFRKAIGAKPSDGAGKENRRISNKERRTQK
jgi:hypothetical protein